MPSRQPPWAGSTRRKTLPKSWHQIRGHVLKRDGRVCRLQTPGLCIGTATEVDHINDRDGHTPENLRAVCRPCHQERSSQQGGQANGVRRRAQAAARKRPTEAHPGVL